MSSPVKPPTSPQPVMVAPLATQGIHQPAPTGRRLSDNVAVTPMERLRENFRYTRGRGALEIGVITALVFIAFCIASLVAPTSFPFLSPSNLSGVISQSIPVYAILSIGAGILMITDEFDLSLGANIGFSAIVFIRVTESSGWPIGALVGIAAAVSIALINGIVVIATKIPSFIATLGLGFFWLGASFFVNGTAPAVLRADEGLKMIFAGDFGVFRSQLIWMLIIGVAAWVFLHRHKTGNHLFAVGGNAAAAKAISINPVKVKLLAFGILGLMVGIAAVLISVRTNAMQPGTTQDYTLMAIAGAVVGGCSLNGGRGSITGMIVGAALIQLIQNGLILAKAPGFYVQLFVGLLIVVAAVFNKLMEGKAS
ncbi:ABC transporter permease [Microbacteriaceae bacterium VKM Ac-2854]|nr:ABC transporter permease [Microbacteriaceae bacterium VKM Ac-2854]